MAANLPKIPTPYEPRTSGSDGKPFVSGPGDGTSYDSGTLYSDMRLSSEKDAIAAAKIANEGFRAGALWAQARMREALGLG